MNTHRIPLLVLAFSLVFLAACGGDDNVRPRNADLETTTPATPTRTEVAEPEAVVAFDGPAFEMAMTPVGDEMKFEQVEFTVKPGQTVRLVFQNTATNPAMQHNVVVVKTDEAVNAVGQAAMGAADTEYIPASERDQIIGYTPLAQPGDTVEVEFTAPSVPGDYPYICTFPGHYLMMKGTMHVVA